VNEPRDSSSQFILYTIMAATDLKCELHSFSLELSNYFETETTLCTSSGQTSVGFFSSHSESSFLVIPLHTILV